GGDVDLRVARGGALGKRGKTGDHLERRPCGVDVTDGLVDQGMAVVRVESGELARADASCEQVVVISRDGDHREDLAVLGIHGNAHRLRELVLLYADAQ